MDVVAVWLEKKNPWIKGDWASKGIGASWKSWGENLTGSNSFCNDCLCCKVVHRSRPTSWKSSRVYRANWNHFAVGYGSLGKKIPKGQVAEDKAWQGCW